MKVTVCRKESFNAAHRIAHPEWSDEKNQKIFGACANKNYHGHNYTLSLKLSGQVDPETGYVYDMKKLGELVKKYIIEPLDHKNLNLDVPAFKHRIPTTEHLAIYIYEQLRPHIESRYEIKLILEETDKNYVEYPA
ncbi:MAG: 6-carboxytetrahydropterin synthase [Cytophagales bacterium]|nr:6-carboxytetrahydropterin synthase [Cytophagales bacterium]